MSLSCRESNTTQTCNVGKARCFLFFVDQQAHSLNCKAIQTKINKSPIYHEALDFHIFSIVEVGPAQLS